MTVSSVEIPTFLPHPLDIVGLRARRAGAFFVKQFSYGLVVAVLAALGAGAGAAARANPDLVTLLASAIPSERPASIPAVALPSFPDELLESQDSRNRSEGSTRSQADAVAPAPKRSESIGIAANESTISPWRPVEATDKGKASAIAQTASPERPASVPDIAPISTDEDAPAAEPPRNGAAPTSDLERSPKAAALAEINAIRQDMLELLSRLAVLEAQLAAGTYDSAPNPAAGVTTSDESQVRDSSAANADNERAEAIAAGGESAQDSTGDRGISPEGESSPANAPEGDASADMAAAPPSLQVGTQTISLPGDVLFDIDRADIRPEAAQLLAEVAQSIQQDYGSGRIRVIGHTDNTGPKDYNMTLSLRRANAVKSYLNELMDDNSDKYTWTAVGRGPDNPVADNASSAGRQLNRRVDLIVAP